ncbi:MAG: ATP-binding protein [Phycisphaerales bacterium JB063]
MQRIIGQQRAKSLLESQLATGRVHHAQIFHGPAGVGKFTTAGALAKRLLCHTPATDLMGNTAACDQCASCRLLKNLDDLAQRDAGDPDDPAAVLSSPHPDLHLIAKELALFDENASVRASKQSNIPISIIRSKLIGPAYLAPKLGHGKVFIVDEAELLDGVGQNAILKTLEEPPEQTYIILVTSREDELLPTIRSRSQRVPFVPLSDEEVGRWLDRHTRGGEGDTAGDGTGPMEEKLRKWVIGFAQGSIGRASLAVRYDLAEWGQSVLSPIHRMSQGGRPEAQLGASIAERVDGFAKRWVGDHKNASKLAANRRAAALMGSMIANFARRRMAQLAPTCDPEAPAQSELALAPWLGVIAAVGEAERQLAANVNLNLVCAGLGASITAAILEPGPVV